jgi:pSer/pThr/pTyr-binding forkhead associated (FHA) protein
MRFEVSYPGGSTHQVELPGDVCVVGRDPGCDLVLNDSKCSRRHAVVESGPEGIAVRDSGSANGIYVNGKKVDKAPLRPGDTLRLGEVKLKLLPEIGETVVVAPEGLAFDAPAGPVALDSGPLAVPHDTPAAAPRPGPSLAAAPAVARPSAPVQQPRPRPSARLRGPERPATVSLLAGLWAFFVPVAVTGVLLGAARLQVSWIGWLAAAILAMVCAGLGTAMALGLRALAAWARHLQIATAAVGLLACPFTLAAATVLLYMTRPEVKAAFDGVGGGAGTDSAEPTFALSLVGMLLLGLALTAIGVLVF